MAIFDMQLGTVDGAVLSIEVDDVAQECRRVKVNATAATHAVEVTFFDAGAIGAQFKKPVQIGKDIDDLIPPGQRPLFQLGLKFKPDGSQVLQLIKPEYVFQRAA